MKVLIVGDAAVPTGFARCTHSLADELYLDGHKVHVLGLNYFGDPTPYPYPIYPCIQPLDHCRNAFGVDRLPLLIERINPDVVVLLNDPWNIAPYLDYIDDLNTYRKDNNKGSLVPTVPIVGWLAVDGENQQSESLNRLTHVVVWTQFAKDELSNGGYNGQPSIVPLGVDHGTFYPVNKRESRRNTLPPSIPLDAFIVGVVGRNQPRKRLDLTLESFAKFVHDNDASNVYLYLHVAPTGDRGIDVPKLVKYYGLQGRVLLPQLQLGIGRLDSAMAETYSAFDVYLTTTQGEGWGLPTLEAMACGVPCVVPDYSGLGSWVTPGAAVKVPVSTTLPSAPLNGLAYTVGAVPSADAVAGALGRLYRDASLRSTVAGAGRELAESFSWERTGQMMVEVLKSIVGQTHTERKIV